MQKGFGEGKLLYFDCFSGLSGDMIVSAFLDLGVPFSIIENAVKKLSLKGVVLRHENEFRHAVKVSRFFVDVDDTSQPHRHFSHIKNMIDKSDLDVEIKNLATEIFLTVARAEASVHGTSIEKVHFHEVGAADSIADIVGAAAAIIYTGASIISAPVPLGSGFVNTQHGILPLPAPATLEILKGVPVYGTDIKAELTTPTGAAIVKTVAVHFDKFPQMVPVNTGMGAGSRSHKERPGIFRLILGIPSKDKYAEKLKILEANIDDMTGELAGHVLSHLLNRGAKDVWIENILMKKGRPGIKLCTLCDQSDELKLSELIMKHTTTLGVRSYDVGRFELKRKFETVKTRWGEVSVKIAVHNNKIYNISVEFDDCVKLSATNDATVKDIMNEASGIANREFRSGD